MGLIKLERCSESFKKYLLFKGSLCTSRISLILLIKSKLLFGKRFNVYFRFMNLYCLGSVNMFFNIYLSVLITANLFFNVKTTKISEAFVHHSMYLQMFLGILILYILFFFCQTV